MLGQALIVLIETLGYTTAQAWRIGARTPAKLGAAASDQVRRRRRSATASSAGKTVVASTEATGEVAGGGRVVGCLVTLHPRDLVPAAGIGTPAGARGGSSAPVSLHR